MDSNQFGRMLGLQADIEKMVLRGTRDPKVVADVLQVVNDDPGFVGRLLQPPVKVDSVALPVGGSKLEISVEDCNRFLRDFGRVGKPDCAKLAQAPRPGDRHYWPIPDVGWSYKQIRQLVERNKVPFFWDLTVDKGFDVRKPVKTGRLLWAPAGVEAVDACPQFRGVSCNTLWDGHKNQIVTAREAIILWLLVRFVSNGETLLDRRGWTRTGSRDVDGFGVYVSAGGEGLRVGWDDPTDVNPDGGARSVVLA